MSRVFVAREVSLNRDIVVKVLPAEMSAAVSVARFKREIQLAARMQHPHIVPLLSAGETGGLPYFTMPFIEGESLRARLSRDGELPVSDALRILRNVASALAYAHAHGVVHRDIKPENIMISGDSAVVTDFGVAKALADAAGGERGGTLTSRGVALGTFAYMAPEQASADPSADHRADVYSFGVVGFEMLAGDPPFGRRTAEATIAAHMVEAPPLLTSRRSAVPARLAGLIAQCLAKRPADRPQSAKDCIVALDSIQTGEASATPIGRARRRSAAVVLFGAAFVAILATIGTVLWSKRSESRLAPAGDGRVRTVAVLPFVNAGAASDDRYFSEGMSDELSSALAKIPGLRVASRTSTFAAGEIAKGDIAEIGRRLHVDAVLEGRLQRRGERLRLTAQLTNVSDGLAVWSDSYEREVKDVFAVQDEISHAIAQALRVAIRPGSASDRGQGTTDIEAYDLYLRGRYFWYKRDMSHAIEFLERATKRDPHFARAFAALASSYELQLQYIDHPDADLDNRARAAASTALAIDSSQAEAYSALGLAYTAAREWKAAESALLRATAIDPSDATAHQWLGELYFQTGRLPESVAEMRKAVDLDPMAPVTAFALSYALYLSGQPKEAVLFGERAVQLGPSIGMAHATVAQAYLSAGDTVKARAEAAEAYRLDSTLAIRAGDVAVVSGATGDRAGARRIYRAMLAREKSVAANPLARFLALLGTGDTTAALGALDEAIQSNDVYLTLYPLASEPMFDPIRHNPRFVRALKQLGLSAR
jgi:serine/threonine-protein kinase